MTSKYDLYSKLIFKYGNEMQIIVAIEELSELQKALTKTLRGTPDIHNIAEEIADVEIMCEQLRFMFACTAECIEKKFKKIERIKKLVKKEKNNDKYNITTITGSI